MTLSKLFTLLQKYVKGERLLKTENCFRLSHETKLLQSQLFHITFLYYVEVFNIELLLGWRAPVLFSNQWAELDQISRKTALLSKLKIIT